MFQSAADTLLLKDAGAMDGLIRGFGTGEKIDLLGNAAPGMSLVNDILTIRNGSTVGCNAAFQRSLHGGGFQAVVGRAWGALVSYVATEAIRSDAVHGIGARLMPHAI